MFGFRFIFEYLRVLSVEMNLSKNGITQKPLLKERTELFKDCQQRKKNHCSVGMSEFISPLPVEKKFLS
jgi:hypothetical protein